MSTASTTPAPSPWNLPNALTVMRILLVPVFVWLVLRHGGGGLGRAGPDGRGAGRAGGDARLSACGGSEGQAGGASEAEGTEVTHCGPHGLRVGAGERRKVKGTSSRWFQDASLCWAPGKTRLRKSPAP